MIGVTLRNASMAENVHCNRLKAGHMKMTIINFQKVKDQIKTSYQSTCEIDFEVCYLQFCIVIQLLIVYT